MAFSLFLGLVSFKALIEESEMKKFPDNDLLRHLRLVTQDAEKCASVAQQLLNGKRQTRYVLLEFGLWWLNLETCCDWFSFCPQPCGIGILESGNGDCVCSHRASLAFVFIDIDLVEEKPKIS